MYKISETDFLKQIIDLCHALGYVVAHFRPGMNQRGRWMTAVSGDGAGFPDLVLVKDRVIYAELKSEHGKTAIEQDKWLSLLKLAGQETYVWKPSQFEEIVRILE
jgi:hypothetical protein